MIFEVVQYLCGFRIR